VLTQGQRHEQPVLPILMERGAVKRPERARPRIRPERVAGDKGYSSLTIRRYLLHLLLRARLCAVNRSAWSTRLSSATAGVRQQHPSGGRTE
jgi:hypothetical protein